jgi:hypothetical protein
MSVKKYYSSVTRKKLANYNKATNMSVNSFIVLAPVMNLLITLRQLIIVFVQSHMIS